MTLIYKEIIYIRERGKIFMPETMIDIPIKNIAYMIDNMDKQELETLYMFLTEEGAELPERNKDLKLGRAHYLSEEQVFTEKKDINIDTLRMELKTLTQNETTHLEEEFENYEGLYPYEEKQHGDVRKEYIV
jgi:hypothetical protein